MNTPINNRRRPLRTLIMLVVVGLLLALPAAALAHPLDVYLQATYITVAPTGVVVELDLSPGVLVAPQMLPLLDTNNDQQISDAESQAYVKTVLQDIVLQVDGQAVALAITAIDMPPYSNLQAGYGTIRVVSNGTLSASADGARQLYYKNNFAPAGSAYQVNGFVDKGVAVTLGKQSRDSIQQSMTMPYTVGVSAAAAAAPAAGTSASGLSASPLVSASTQTQQMAAYLYDNSQSPWLFLLGLGVAALLGALHALTPGHGKTLAATYLVGSRATPRHAVALGATVTVTHTASVILVGLLALFASQFIVPNTLAPLLEVCSGLLVVALGARLLWRRWLALRGVQRSGMVGDHSHGGVAHSHGHSESHSHMPGEQQIGRGGILALGVSGGLIPCPEALGIMIIAISLNKVFLGLGLIVAFSVGLAAMLIGLGLLLVRSRALLDRAGFLRGRWQQALPLASAAIVLVLGLGIACGGLITYFGRG